MYTGIDIYYAYMLLASKILSRLYKHFLDYKDQAKIKSVSLLYINLLNLPRLHKTISEETTLGF